jgi:hypothetical protein
MGGAHPHLIVNHVPLVATGLSILLLLFARAKPKDPGRMQAALLILVVAGLGSGVAFLTGIAAEEAVAGMVGIQEERIHQHHAPALAASVISLATAGLAMICFVILRRRGPPLQGGWFAGILAASLVAAGLLAWASNLGGVIHHPEIR